MRTLRMSPGNGNQRFRGSLTRKMLALVLATVILLVLLPAATSAEAPIVYPNLGNFGLETFEECKRAELRSHSEFFGVCEIDAAWAGEISLFDCPDFAGMYINDERQVVLKFVYGSEGHRNALARKEEMNGILACASRSSVRQPLVIRGATYSYEQLNEVRELLFEKLFENPNSYNVNFKDTDIQNNRIEISTIDMSGVAGMRTEITSYLNDRLEGWGVSGDIISIVHGEECINPNNRGHQNGEC